MNRHDLPPELVEILGQLRMAHTLLSRLQDDANDAWCEEGGGWEPEAIEWCILVDRQLKLAADDVLSLIKVMEPI